MNPILEQIYATILPSAPYVIAAYTLMWLVLLAYVVFTVVGLKKTEARMTALEQAVARKKEN